LKLDLSHPIQYTKTPLISGYVSKQNLDLLKESVPFKSIKKEKDKSLFLLITQILEQSG
jgi:hypothetical protein